MKFLVLWHIYARLRKYTKINDITDIFVNQAVTIIECGLAEFPDELISMRKKIYETIKKESFDNLGALNEKAGIVDMAVRTHQITILS